MSERTARASWTVCDHVVVCDVWAEESGGTFKVHAMLPHAANRARITKLSNAACGCSCTFVIEHLDASPASKKTEVISTSGCPYVQGQQIAVRYRRSGADRVLKITMDQPDGVKNFPTEDCDSNCRCSTVTCP